MDGEVLSVSQHKTRAKSGGSATPMLGGMAYQNSSSFWRRLIIGASDASPKILVSLLGAATIAQSFSIRSAVRHASCVWSNPWPT